jgi:hypothetical protein
MPGVSKGMAAVYLHTHMRQVHGRQAPSMESPENLTSIGNPASCFYSVTPPPYIKSVEYPVDGCPGRACNRGHL